MGWFDRDDEKTKTSGLAGAFSSQSQQAKSFMQQCANRRSVPSSYEQSKYGINLNMSDCSDITAGNVPYRFR